MNKIYEKILIKSGEASRQLAISQRTLWQITKDGQIPCVRIKRMVRYDQEDITAYINGKKIKEINLINPQNSAHYVGKGV
jgi:predicted DNA-binding transcriptional regulator AlpA